MAWEYIERIRKDLNKSQEEDTGRFRGMNDFFNKSIGSESPFSWGVLILAGFGIYAVYNLVTVILRLF